MTPTAKQQLQGAFFEILLASEAHVGDVLDIGYGLMYMTLNSFHVGDSMKVIADLRKATDQVCENIARGKVSSGPPLAIVPGGKLDS
jgi:hypothetical protein